MKSVLEQQMVGVLIVLVALCIACLVLMFVWFWPIWKASKRNDVLKVPTNISSITVIMHGGGGSGGSIPPNGGGGGGTPISLAPGEVKPIGIGSGGGGGKEKGGSGVTKAMIDLRDKGT